MKKQPRCSVRVCVKKRFIIFPISLEADWTIITADSEQKTGEGIPLVLSETSLVKHFRTALRLFYLSPQLFTPQKKVRQKRQGDVSSSE